MKRSTSCRHRQAQWRERLVRQEQSGQSAAAFCKSEGIAAATFYWWRARLGNSRQAESALRPRDAAPFIDLGAPAAPAAPAGQVQDMAEGFSIRLDLPGGIVLTVARR